MMTRPLAKILLATGLAACAVAPAYAHVGPIARVSITSVAVKTHDLDLATPAGERELRNRVAKAVRQACRLTDVETGQRVLSHDARVCASKARASADRQVAALLSDEQRGG
jgi:UrcA family protein